MLNSYAHVSGQVLDALPLGEDLGGHAVAFALVDTAPLADGNPGSILTSVLEKIERLVEVNGGRGGLCITQLASNQPWSSVAREAGTNQ
jgi:hypothetical protein